MSQEIQNYLEETAPQYDNKFIEFESFKKIIRQMAEIDKRCDFDDEVIQQLFDFVWVKQNGQVCFGAVVGLALEILKERTSYAPPNFEVANSKQKTLWEQVSLILDQVSSDLMHQMKFVYEQCLEEQFRNQEADSDEDNQEQTSSKKKPNDILSGMDVDFIIQKVEEMNTLDQNEKDNIDFLFKCIQNEEGRVTHAGLGDLMSLLEQYWISLVQPIQNNNNNNSDRTSQVRGSIIQNTQKNTSLTRLPDDDESDENSSKHKKRGLEEEDNNEEGKQFYKYDYMQDLMHKVDILRETKGQKKQFYEIIDEMFNSLLLLGTKLDAYEMEIEMQTKKNVTQQDDSMKLEQKVTYLETEMRRLIDYKEDIELQYDELCKEHDILEQKYLFKEQKEKDSLQAIEGISKLETQCASLKRNYNDLERKYEDIKKENEQLQQESDKMFDLFKTTQAELDQIKMQQSQLETSSALANNEFQGKSHTDYILLQKLKDENKSIQFKLQILNDEANRYRLQFETREEEYAELQRVHKQLLSQYEEACVVSRDKPMRLFNDQGGRRSTRYSIKPLSGGLGFGRNSIRKSIGRPSIQFGQQQSSGIDLDSHLETRNETDKQNGRISFNYSTRGSVFNEENKGNDFILNSENSIRSSAISGRMSVNFDKFWDQFQSRMSVANQNIQLEKQASKQTEQKSELMDPNNPQYYANFFAFDENELYARDFLGLRDNKKIIQVLEKYSDVDNPNEMRCFSDSIYRINNKNERERRILFATPYNIFILHTRNFKVIRRIQIDRITKMTFLNKSAYLCVISIKQEYDYFIETYRRADFNIFLMQSIKERTLVPYKIQFTDEINIQFRGIKDKINIGQMDERTLLNRFQASFKSAHMVGFMEICKHSWIKDFFSEPWKEYFFVLTNIGLLSFLKPGESKPQLFIPVNDALVIKDPAGQEKKFCIKIFYQNSNQHYILACMSKADQDKWLESIRKVIYQSVNINAKRDQLMKSQYLDPKDIIEEQPEEG